MNKESKQDHKVAIHKLTRAVSSLNGVEELSHMHSGSKESYEFTEHLADIRSSLDAAISMLDKGY